MTLSCSSHCPRQFLSSNICCSNDAPGHCKQPPPLVTGTRPQVEQARLLAEYWAPLLMGKAEAGELHVFVSAMQVIRETNGPRLPRAAAMYSGMTSQLYMCVDTELLTRDV